MNKSSPFRVIFEDNHLLIVNKSAGILVQGDITGDVPLVDLAKQYVKEKYAKPGAVFLGVVHRIDRPVSGLVILARTSKSLERMNALFRDKRTKKTYWAIVKNRPPQEQGHLVHWLTKDEKKNKSTAHTREIAGALKSELNYKVIANQGGYYLLEVNPITGRPHQIRVQLASMNCPIKGDVKYGYPDLNDDGSICLHARRIQFEHPVKKEPADFEASLPENDNWSAFANFSF